MKLTNVYLESLARCSPDRLIAGRSGPGDVVAIGKCAGALLDGFVDARNAFVAMPDGYREPRARADVHKGGHPDMTAESFAAGRALIAFVDAHDDLTFLISGGGSACVDMPLEPFTEDELIDTNRKLVDSGVPIGEINCVRKHLSAIKGGRLGARVRGRCVTYVLSDVSSGALADVASGPTLADPTTRDEAVEILRRIGGCESIIDKLHDETPKEVRGDVVLLADNTTLVRAAADVARERGFDVTTIDEQIEDDVAVAAAMLARRAESLRENEVLIAGGEPTVVKRGDGKGGRCSELAVRFALDCHANVTALFASSDGVDGNSGVAGISMRLPARIDRAAAEEALARSDSFRVAGTAGVPIIIPASGNNLRDLYILARG